MAHPVMNRSSVSTACAEVLEDRIDVWCVTFRREPEVVVGARSLLADDERMPAEGFACATISSSPADCFDFVVSSGAPPLLSGSHMGQSASRLRATAMDGSLTLNVSHSGASVRAL
jgi:hypothetical protein